MKRSYGARTCLIVIGISLFYVMQMAPSPVLHLIREDLVLGNSDLLLNLSVSLIFPPIVLGSLTGTGLERRIGTKGVYTAALALCMAGAACALLCGRSYLLFLIGRVVFGLGFGFGIPFIGSAIMGFFRPEHRELMDTVNAMFPFVGTLLTFLLALPLCSLHPAGWRVSTGIWCLPLLLILLLWLPVDFPSDSADPSDGAVFRDLLRRRDIRLLCGIFLCDFCCYSYLAVVLPALLQEGCGLQDAQANLWSAAAFPAMGLIGSVSGGIWCRRSGLRKPSLIAGQILKLFGIMLMTLPSRAGTAAVVGGASLFGFANGLWMPAMYCMPMELPEMTQARAGAAFGLISACGLVFGFIAPTLGGAATDALRSLAPSGALPHVFGLRWSLFAFGLLNLPAFVCSLALRESGPGAKARS